MEVKSNGKNGSEYAEANPGDILSDFPDEMLSHILSFLPTEYAVRTSILSSRWKDVYKGVPNIKSSIDAYVLRMAVLEKIATLRVKMCERMAILERITTVRVKMSELHVKMRKTVEDINALEKLDETMTASTSAQRSDTHDEEEDAAAAAAADDDDEDEDDVGSESESE